jgi:predicted TIM-barrel fold metal-dependent hydrolase
MMDLTGIPILDHHCHPLDRPGAPLSAATFRPFFAETTDPAQGPHIAHTVFYQRLVRDVTALFGVEPTEAAFLALRAATPFALYARRLFEAGHFQALLIDTGFRSVHSYEVAEQRALSGVPAAPILRLEPLMEELIAAHTTLAAIEAALRAAVQGARAQGIVALKSIAAYRGGLHVARRTPAEAAAALPALQETARRTGRLRLTDRPVLEYLLRAALEEAARQALPVQFHVAFGDDDADLRTASPLHLRALLTDPALRAVPFVLLHCYPYVREAGYLASLYGHVFVDVSLAVPLTAHGSAAVFAEALELAPVSKLLFGTDAYGVPELFFAGARYGRGALGQTLGRLVAEDWLTAAQAEAAAEAILWRNAAALYGIASA